MKCFAPGVLDLETLDPRLPPGVRNVETLDPRLPPGALLLLSELPSSTRYGTAIVFRSSEPLSL